MKKMTQREINRALSPFADSQDGESYEDYMKWLAAKRKEEEEGKLKPPALIVTSPGGTQMTPVNRIAEIPNLIPQGKYFSYSPGIYFRNCKSRNCGRKINRGSGKAGWPKT